MPIPLPAMPPAETLLPFSEREKDVIKLLMQGRSNKEMAQALGISDRTVEFHLKNIYAKLQVRSRAEAIIQLGKSTGSHLVESSVEEAGKSNENGPTTISPWRISMKNLLLITTTLLLAALLIVFLLPGKSAQTASLPSADVSTITNTPSPAPTTSARTRIMDQVRQAVADYEQVVQAEKKTGKVKIETDPQTGREVFFFQDESAALINKQWEDLNEKINQLDDLYAQVYRDEIQPTPFPTQQTPEENQAFYEDQLASKGPKLCHYTPEPGPNTFLIYNPDSGEYHPVELGDRSARCVVWGQMLNEFHEAPMAAKINHEADMNTIRTILRKPDLALTFQSVDALGNAPWQNIAIYTDPAGWKYSIDIETGRLTQIEPFFPTHISVPAEEKKSLEALRSIARQFALDNSPRLAGLEAALRYEENGKGDLYFFDWRYTSKDWSNTDWVMMPPMLQVGILANGQIVVYINTLDLYKE